MEEGNIWESLMAANKYHLNNLIAILDRNRIQLDGFTENIMPLDDIGEKVKTFGWDIINIDGNDMGEVISAIEKAKKSKNKPTMIVANTIKGKGVSYMENNPKYHGAPPKNEEEYNQALREIGGI